jgi:hypothetical protein
MLAFNVTGVNFVSVSWLPIGQQCLIVSSASRAFDSHWLEEFANCTPTAEKMTNAAPSILS